MLDDVLGGIKEFLNEKGYLLTIISMNRSKPLIIDSIRVRGSNGYFEISLENDNISLTSITLNMSTGRENYLFIPCNDPASLNILVEELGDPKK